MRAARARSARERAGLGLRVGRDGAVPLLRRRLRGGRARVRPGAAAAPPAEARPAGAGARAALLSPDGLRGRGVLPGRAQPLPHGPRAVGARVCLRLSLPHRAGGTAASPSTPARRRPHPPRLARPAATDCACAAGAFQASGLSSYCTEIKCGKWSLGVIPRSGGAHLSEGHEPAWGGARRQLHWAKGDGPGTTRLAYRGFFPCGDTKERGVSGNNVDGSRPSHLPLGPCVPSDVSRFYRPQRWASEWEEGAKWQMRSLRSRWTPASLPPRAASGPVYPHGATISFHQLKIYVRCPSPCGDRSGAGASPVQPKSGAC